MIDYLVLPDSIMSHEKVTVPGEPEPIILNFVVIKGVHDIPTEEDGSIPKVRLVYPTNNNCSTEACLGIANIYEIKHMVLSDLHRYTKLMKFFHDSRYRTYFKLRTHLESIYDGIIDGEIVTVIFFTPGKGLLDGTTAAAETEQGPEQV